MRATPRPQTPAGLAEQQGKSGDSRLTRTNFAYRHLSLPASEAMGGGPHTGPGWCVAHVGPTRTLIVTYLLPCMALVYGALLLHEPVGLNAIGGLALVLTGIFVTGKKSGQRIATSADIETTMR